MHPMQRKQPMPLWVVGCKRRPCETWQAPCTPFGGPCGRSNAIRSNGFGSSDIDAISKHHPDPYAAMRGSCEVMRGDLCDNPLRAITYRKVLRQAMLSHQPQSKLACEESCESCDAQAMRAMRPDQTPSYVGRQQVRCKMQDLASCECSTHTRCSPSYATPPNLMHAKTLTSIDERSNPLSHNGDGGVGAKMHVTGQRLTSFFP
jgi:hypothetical protein